MTPDRVIKHLDVVEYVSLGFFSGCIDSALCALAFSELGKALRDRIVIAVTLSAHTGGKVVSFQEVSPIMACELAALVGVQQRGVLGLAPSIGPRSRALYQYGFASNSQ
jgi:hypothetical protein